MRVSRHIFRKSQTTLGGFAALMLEISCSASSHRSWRARRQLQQRVAGEPREWSALLEKDGVIQSATREPHNNGWVLI
jgi:hypothetical protein